LKRQTGFDWKAPAAPRARKAPRAAIDGERAHEQHAERARRGQVGLRPHLRRAVVAPHRDVVPAHADVRRSDAHVVIRTSLSLIGFGFTIFQVFQKLYEAKVLQNAQAPRNFGMALVLLGEAMLVLGIVYHVKFMVELRRERQRMKADALIHGESRFPVSLTLIVAVLLLLLGLSAIVGMAFNVGPLN
jgi:putative membrane protein